ncbi:hypothetical protein CDL15_Pgr005766 [Punica granatum]|uniref:Uncharacterized protein n=1 Tax=Punica granatum TaxID=22663 RepID=A0A218WGH7_PUNGR|nr:hypothetical protein CDL15_Pgr005766 [Punica granatum]
MAALTMPVRYGHNEARSSIAKPRPARGGQSKVQQPRSTGSDDKACWGSVQFHRVKNSKSEVGRGRWQIQVQVRMIVRWNCKSGSKKRR